jgi:hypothetical protein
VTLMLQLLTLLIVSPGYNQKESRKLLELQSPSDMLKCTTFTLLSIKLIHKDFLLWGLFGWSSHKITIHLLQVISLCLVIACLFLQRLDPQLNFLPLWMESTTSRFIYPLPPIGISTTPRVLCQRVTQLNIFLLETMSSVLL